MGREAGPVIVEVAIDGMTTREQHPRVPQGPEAIFGGDYGPIGIKPGVSFRARTNSSWAARSVLPLASPDAP